MQASHGRDNLIHVHQPHTSHGSSLAGGPGPSRAAPTLAYSLDTNSLNFCRFSLCPIPSSVNNNDKGKEKEHEALLAVPNLVDSELADMYHLPSCRRLHASINYSPKTRPLAPVGDGEDTMSVKLANGRTGLIMGLHLGFHPQTKRLTLVMGFEDGRVELWGCKERPDTAEGVEGDEEETWSRSWDARIGKGEPLWERLWETKGHNEAGESIHSIQMSAAYRLSHGNGSGSELGSGIHSLS